MIICTSCDTELPLGALTSSAIFIAFHLTSRFRLHFRQWTSNNKSFLLSSRTVTNKTHTELVCKQLKSKEKDLSISLISWSACLFYSYRNETIKTRQRREADGQKTNTAPLVLRVRVVVVCYVLYRVNSRGTQNTRTSSTDITLSNILW